MKFSYHLLWLWVWFFCGMFVYMLKRAYYLVTGPNPVANTYGEFVHKCWIPLLVRAFVDSIVYWLSFYPEVLSAILQKAGWNITFHSPLPEFGVVAALFGLSVDSVVDFAVTKIPYAKDWLPQMPPPLKAQAPAPAPQPQP